MSLIASWKLIFFSFVSASKSGKISPRFTMVAPQFVRTVHHQTNSKRGVGHALKLLEQTFSVYLIGYNKAHDYVTQCCTMSDAQKLVRQSHWLWDIKLKKERPVILIALRTDSSLRKSFPKMKNCQRDTVVTRRFRVTHNLRNAEDYWYTRIFFFNIVENTRNFFYRRLC